MKKNHYRGKLVHLNHGSKLRNNKFCIWYPHWVLLRIRKYYTYNLHAFSMSNTYNISNTSLKLALSLLQSETKLQDPCQMDALLLTSILNTFCQVGYGQSYEKSMYSLSRYVKEICQLSNNDPFCCDIKQTVCGQRTGTNTNHKVKHQHTKSRHGRLCFKLHWDKFSRGSHFLIVIYLICQIFHSCWIIVQTITKFTNFAGINLAEQLSKARIHFSLSWGFNSTIFNFSWHKCCVFYWFRHLARIFFAISKILIWWGFKFSFVKINPLAKIYPNNKGQDMNFVLNNKSTWMYMQ